MLESRWARRIGPGIVALGAVAIVASTTLGARERAWDPPPCPGLPDAAASRDGGATGVWYRLDPVLDAGRLVGQRLAVGVAGAGRPRTLALPGESFAAGPFGRAVLVGADDGRSSTLSLVDPAAGCARIVATSADVIRRATITPDGTTLVETRVARESREDLGVHARSLHGAASDRPLLPPIGADARFGPTWTTELAWSVEGDRLAVQSCGALDCRTRILDPATGGVDMIDEPGLGDMVGLGAGRLIVHGACGGLPCPLLAVPIDGGPVETVDDAAGQAVLTVGSDGRPFLVHESGPDGAQIRVRDLDGRSIATFGRDEAGRRLVAGSARSGTAADAAPGTVLFAPDGRLPLDGAVAPIARRLADGYAVPFEEIAR